MQKFNRDRKPKWNTLKKDKPAKEERKYKAPYKSSTVRDGVRPMMHTATCSECNASCQVPFKPNGKKPVLCHNCYRPEGEKLPKTFIGKEARGDRKLFKAICDDCGKACEVPFLPLEGKRIRCGSCLGHKDTSSTNALIIMDEQFVILNNKLETILKELKRLQS